MAVKDTEIETIIRVHHDGVALEVGENADNPKWVEIRTPDKVSAEFYGKIAFVLPPNVALALGKALVQVATSKGASL